MQFYAIILSKIIKYFNNTVKVMMALLCLLAGIYTCYTYGDNLLITPFIILTTSISLGQMFLQLSVHLFVLQKLKQCLEIISRTRENIPLSVQ